MGSRNLPLPLVLSGANSAEKPVCSAPLLRLPTPPAARRIALLRRCPDRRDGRRCLTSSIARPRRFSSCSATPRPSRLVGPPSTLAWLRKPYDRHSSWSRSSTDAREGTCMAQSLLGNLTDATVFPGHRCDHNHSSIRRGGVGPLHRLTRAASTLPARPANVLALDPRPLPRRYHLLPIASAHVAYVRPSAAPLAQSPPPTERYPCDGECNMRLRSAHCFSAALAALLDSRRFPTTCAKQLRFDPVFLTPCIAFIPDGAPVYRSRCGHSCSLAAALPPAVSSTPHLAGSRAGAAANLSPGIELQDRCTWTYSVGMLSVETGKRIAVSVAQAD